MNNEQLRKEAAEKRYPMLDNLSNSNKITIANQRAAFKEGAEWESEREKWQDADTAIVEDGIIYLGCHHHDNWYSLIYKEKGKWFNDWDHECQCWPSHIMELPLMPFETPPKTSKQ